MTTLTPEPSARGSAQAPAVGDAGPLARGILEQVVPATATRPGYVVFGVPGSSYRLHLRPVPGPEAITTPVGKRLIGVIRVQARRVDVVRTGGRLIEPVIGRPRRIHATVLAQDTARHELLLHAGGAPGVDAIPLPVVARLTDARQSPSGFPVGTLVAFDVLDGATFEPAK